MSSHHFVKEGQEPALIIANGESCSYEMLTGLMEWCPYIVVLDGAYERVKKLQIQPDLVIGDFDSIKDTEMIGHTVFLHDEDQNTTDLEKAINHLIKKKCSDINVVWATGRRLDHTLNNFHILAKFKGTNIVLYDNHSKAFVLPENFSKVYKKDSKLSLVPLHSCDGITTKNLAYNLKNGHLSIGHRSGTSNRASEDGEVIISHLSGTLVLIESED
jgi:thiamine pyrophosphokinase